MINRVTALFNSIRSVAPRGRGSITARALLALGLGIMLMLALPAPQEPAAKTSVLAPDYISARDAELYAQAFAAERTGDIAASAGALERLDNPVLEGYVLAARYTGSHYRPSAQELASWLERFHDHPQAAQIKALAGNKGVKNLETFAIDSKKLKGDGFIDHIGRRTMPDGWYSALSRWKSGEFAQAASLFLAVGKDESLSDWQRAAGYYWAYRADSALGHRLSARAHLRHASAFSNTFYGLLALHARGHSGSLTASAPSVPSWVRAQPHAVRARALASLGKLEPAELELRLLYTDLEVSQRPAIVTLAAELNLANLQVRLAKLRGLDAAEQRFAAYPMPRWLTGAQSEVDPALVLAITRQESVFREEVASPAGALGMMQMLPSTARMMLSGLKDEGVQLASADDSLPIARQLTDPQINIRLGVAYVQHLTQQPYIGSNLVKILAGYNAGPGSVHSWQKTLAVKIDDPLLYIESIPYPETRNYVMQVMAHYWVYQQLQDEPVPTLKQLSAGQWPTV